MSKIAAGGNSPITLGVDLENVAAYQLHQKLGFETQSNFITHAWRDEMASQ
jgi:hypothetical protein